MCAGKESLVGAGSDDRFWKRQGETGSDSNKQLGEVFLVLDLVLLL